VNELVAVTALSDGTVVAVGMGTTNNSAVIVSNQSSAPPAGGSAARVTTTAAPTGTMAAAVEAALVDQFFTMPDRADRPSSLAGSWSGEAKEADIGHLDVFPQDIELWQSD
jgi:hypothetical protein